MQRGSTTTGGGSPFQRYVQSLPKEYHVPLQDNITPLEAAVLYAQHTLELEPGNNDILAQLCATGKFSGLHTLTVPASVFTHDVFSVAPQTNEVTLFTALVGTQPAEPVRLSLSGHQLGQLLHLFFYLAFARENYVQHFGAGSAGLGRVENACVAYDRLAERIQRGDWYGLFNNAGEHNNRPWSPFFIEELKNDASSKTEDEKSVVAYRFWLFVHHERNIHEEFERLVHQITERSQGHQQARAALERGKTELKESVSLVDDAGAALADGPEEGAGSNVKNIVGKLLRHVEQPLHSLLRFGRNSELPVSSQGGLNVVAAMRFYLRHGDVTRIPQVVRQAGRDGGDTDVVESGPEFEPGPFGAAEMPTSLRRGGSEEPLEALADVPSPTNKTPRKSDARRKVQDLLQRAIPSSLLTSNTAARTAKLRYQTSRYIVDATHDELCGSRANQSDPNDPRHISSVFAPLQSFASWMCTSIDPEQRNPFCYFDFQNAAADWRYDDFYRIVALENGPMRDYRNRRDVSFGAIASSVPAALNNDPLTLASLFKGFPRPERVRLVLPSLQPWAWNMLPLPTVIKNEFCMSYALHLLPFALTSSWDKLAIAIQQCPVHAGSLAILAAVSLPYMSADKLRATGVKYELTVPINLTEELCQRTEEEDILISPLTTNFVTQLMRFVTETLSLRRWHALNNITDRSLNTPCVLRFEGLQPRTRLPNSEAPSGEFDESHNYETMACGMDIFIHLHQQTKKLRTLIDAMAGNRTAPSESVRGLLIHQLVGAVSSMHKRVALRAIEFGGVPMSEGMEARRKWYFAQNDRWVTLRSNDFANLDCFGELIQFLNMIGIVVWGVYANADLTCVLCFVILGSSSRSGLGTEVGFIIVFKGAGAVSKSFIMGAAATHVIPETFIFVSRKTAAADSILANVDDLVNAFEEAPAAMMGTSKNPDTKDLDSVAGWKMMMEAGYYSTNTFDVGKQKEGNVRTRQFVLHLCRSSWVFATNDSNKNTSVELMQRMLTFDVKSLVQARVPVGMSIEDFAMHGVIATDTGPSQHNFRLIQFYVTVVHKMILSGALPPVETEDAINWLAVIFADIRKTLAGNGQRLRLSAQLRKYLVIGAISRAVITALHDTLQAHHKYGLSVDGASRRVLPATLAGFVERVKRGLYVTKSETIFMLTLLRQTLDKPLHINIMQYMASLVYETENLSDLTFLTKTIHSSQSNKASNASYSRERGSSSSTSFYSSRSSGGGERAGGGGSTTSVVDKNYVIVPFQEMRFETELYQYVGRNVTSSAGCFSAEHIRAPFAEMRQTRVLIPKDQDANHPDYVIPPLRATRGRSAPAPTGQAVREQGDILLRGFNATDAQLDALAEQMEREERAELAEDGEARTAAADEPTDQQNEQSNDSAPENDTAAAAAENEQNSRFNAAIENIRSMAPELVPGADNSDPAEPIDPDKVNTQGLPVQPPAKHDLQLPLVQVLHTPDGIKVAVLERELRKHWTGSKSGGGGRSSNFAAAAAPFTTSTVWAAINSALSTSNLEVYPDAVVRKLETVYGNLLGTSRTHDGLTLRQHLERGKFTYLTGFTDSAHIANHCYERERKKIRRRPDAFGVSAESFSRGPKGADDEALPPPRWFIPSPEVSRDETRELVLYNLTQPTEADARAAGVALPTDKQNYVMIPEFDIDWLSYKAHCKRFAMDEYDPEWLVTLPAFATMTALAIKGESASKEMYPMALISANCKRVLVSNARRNEALNRHTASLAQLALSDAGADDSDGTAPVAQPQSSGQADDAPFALPRSSLRRRPDPTNPLDPSFNSTIRSTLQSTRDLLQTPPTTAEHLPNPRQRTFYDHLNRTETAESDENSGMAPGSLSPVGISLAKRRKHNDSSSSSSAAAAASDKARAKKRPSETTTTTTTTSTTGATTTTTTSRTTAK